MAKPFSQLAPDTNRRSKQVAVGIGEFVKDAAKIIDKGVILDTRVDTGEARSNWVTTLDNPFTSIIPPYSPGMKLGKSEGANAAAAISQGASAISRFKSSVNRAIFISNNVPHIAILNDLDNQFIERNIMKAKGIANGKKILR